MAVMRAGVILFGLFLWAAGAAAQEPGIVVTGRVLGPGGAPVGNARVELRPVLERPEAERQDAGGQGPAPAAVHATSGPDGLFDFHAPRPGLWRVVVAADGFVPQQRLLPLLEATDLPPAELALSPEGSLPPSAAARTRFPVVSPGGWAPVERRESTRPGPGVLTGRILTGQIIDRETRAPLPRALVWPECDPGRWVWTDADGAFRLSDVAAPCDSGLAAAALDHLPGALSLQSGLPGKPLVLALAPAAALHGTVVDARGRPRANVQLSVARLDGALGEKDASSARTSADGTFRAPGLRTGASYRVTAVLAGFAPASTAVAIPKPRAPVPGLRLVLGRGRAAFGQVVDESGRPVAGARVELAPGTAGRVVPSGLAESGNAPQQTQTGADGRFELRHLPAGWFRLRIEAGGFLTLERDGLQIPAGAARTGLGRFLLQRGTAFQGWAGDPEGTPIAGAEVWIIPTEVRDWSELYAQGPAAVTGMDGSFVVRDLPREASFGIDVCRAGYLPLSATVREISPEPFRAVLDRAARISGRVTAGDGTPVPAARIESWLAGEEPARSESLRPCRRGAGTATADAEGRFQLESLSPGWWSLRAAADGYRATRREQLHVLAGESLDGVEIPLGPGATVSGRVFASGGEPAPGARVSAFSEEGTAQTVAGGDGAYRLAGVEPGQRTIEATLGEGAWASRSLTVVPGDNQLDLTMDQGSAHQEIRGRVLGPDGDPVAGAAVLAAGSARTFSSMDGSFSLEVEDDREYEVWAGKEGFAAARAGVAVRVAGAPVPGVEIRLSRGGSLTGRLLGLDQEELARASVEVDLATPFVSRAAVDPRGSYRIEDVPPGNWSITARSGSRSVREWATLPPDASAVTVDLVFEPSQEVSGWIAGPTGEPVADAYIRFSAPGAPSASTYSRSDGSFRLRLEDGTYRVVARREGYLWTPQEDPVAVEGAPVLGIELRLDEAAVIRGRILGLEPGERAKAVWISAGAANSGRREGKLDQEGGFLIPDVPPGDWTVTVAYRGREVSVPLHLDPGQREEWVEVEIGGP